MLSYRFANKMGRVLPSASQSEPKQNAKITGNSGAPMSDPTRIDIKRLLILLETTIDRHFPYELSPKPIQARNGCDFSNSAPPATSTYVRQKDHGGEGAEQDLFGKWTRSNDLTRDDGIFREGIDGAESMIPVGDDHLAVLRVSHQQQR